MKLKYAKDVTKESANIWIYGEIGQDIDGNQIAAEIRYLNDNGVSLINEFINSEGGNIINGLSIIAANKRSQATIHTYNDGVAASMAGMIFLSGDKRIMESYARLMFHEPSFWGQGIDDIQDVKIKKMLTEFRDMLVEMFSNDTGKTKDESLEILKAETWYNAKDAEKNGLATKVQPLNIKYNNLSKAEILSKIAAKYEEKFKIITKMEILNKTLGLNKDASEEVGVNKVNEMLNNIDDITGKLEAAQNNLDAKDLIIENKDTKIQELTDELTGIKDKAEKEVKDTLIEDAIKDGKITEDQKGTFEKLSNEDLKNVLDTLKVADSVTNFIEKPDGKDAIEITAKTWDTMHKAGTLEALKADDKATFDLLKEVKYPKK